MFSQSFKMEKLQLRVLIDVVGISLEEAGQYTFQLYARRKDRWKKFCGLPLNVTVSGADVATGTD